MTTYKVTEKKLEKEGQAKKVHEFVAKHPGSTSAEIVKGLKSIKPNNVRWHIANLRANGFLKAALEKKPKTEKKLKRPEKSAKALKQAIENKGCFFSSLKSL
jgi:predicted HTH transcriptional regulator